MKKESVEKDIVYLTRQSGFGATKGEIHEFLEHTKQRKLDTSLRGDLLDREVAEMLSLLSNAKTEYLKLLNTQTDSQLPDYAFYTPDTKFEIDLMAKIVLDFYSPFVKEQFKDLPLKADLKVYKENDIYLYTSIDPDNYEVNRDLSIKETERAIRTFAGAEYTVRSFYKDTIKGIRTKQSGISVLFHGWVLFKVYVYPINMILPKFVTTFVNGDHFNEIGSIYTLLVQQHELPHYLYEYEPEQVKRTDIDSLLKALKGSVVNGEQLGIELINKWFPDVFNQRNKSIVNNCIIYVFYFANEIKDLVLTGGNSINIKVNSPIVNDLDFIYTGSLSREQFKKKLTAFAFFIQDRSALKKTEEKIHGKTVSFSFDHVMIRETRNEKRKLTMYSIDLVFKEAMGNTYIISKYTLCEFGIPDHRVVIDAVPLIVEFNGKVSDSLSIQSAATDLSKFKNMDIGPRTKSKIERDLDRLKVLMSKMKSFGNEFHYTQPAQYTYQAFEKYIELLYLSDVNVPKTEIMFMNPVDKYLMPTPDTVTISKVLFNFHQEKGKLGNLLSKYRTTVAVKTLEKEIEEFTLTQNDLDEYRLKLIEKMKKRYDTVMPNKKINYRVYTMFTKEKVFPIIRDFGTKLVDSFGPNITAFKRLNVMKYVETKYKTNAQGTVTLLGGDPKILADEFREVLLKVLFQDTETYEEFMDVLSTLIVHFPILNVNDDIRSILENIVTLYVFVVYSTMKNIEYASILNKVAELNTMHMYDILAAYIQKNLTEADIAFLNKIYK